MPTTQALCKPLPAVHPSWKSLLRAVASNTTLSDFLLGLASVQSLELPCLLDKDALSQIIHLVRTSHQIAAAASITNSQEAWNNVCDHLRQALALLMAVQEDCIEQVHIEEVQESSNEEQKL